MAKVRSLLAPSFFLLSFSALGQDAGEAEKEGETKAKWPGPTTAESPTRTLGDNHGSVTDGRGATVALFHPSAAAHASSPTRGSRLKRRARTALCVLGHVEHD
jgi:hypothetical protein